MKLITLVTILFMSFHAKAVLAATIESIDELLWKNRIVILDQPQDVQAASAELARQQYEIDDRDIVWFIIEPQRILSNHVGELSTGLQQELRDSFGAGPGRVVLVGKDGGTKASYDRLDLEAIFSAIDAMPMRQMEMLR